MGCLILEKVWYQGDRYFFESPDFGPGVVIIEGDNGTGKTTLSNLIYYGLGGHVDEFKHDSKNRHAEILEDKNHSVTLRINLSQKRYLFKRNLHDNEIIVSSLNEETPAKVLSIHRSPNHPYTFSDWIFDQLGLSVVELTQGIKTFKMTFQDLLRLIYHDQATDPNKIFQRAKTDGNYISDSKMMRNAIFQILIGKTYSELYKAIANKKRLEQETNLAKQICAEYERIADGLLQSYKKTNLSHLKEQQKEFEEQLERLLLSRKTLKKNRANLTVPLIETDELKNRFIQLEIESKELNSKIVDLYQEKSDIVELKRTTRREIERLQKILFTHEQLHLFAPDTCPNCLSTVQREQGKCICGSKIDEGQYERFFYSDQEYKELLSSKLKSLETIELGIQGVEEERRELELELAEKQRILEQVKEAFVSTIAQMDQNPVSLKLDQIEDQILEVKEKAGEISKAIQVEQKLIELNESYEEKNKDLAEAKRTEKEKLIQAERDLETKIHTFSKYYTHFMTQSLKGCRSARIDQEDYLPIINGGEYREKSADVSKRFCYYLTMMQMALNHPDVPFPCFLLIDTPETGGIDPEPLKKVIGQIDHLKNPMNQDFQVFLSTGPGKYPEPFKKHVAVTLFREDGKRLLQLRSITP